jgi:hypothetical protein
MKKWIGVLMASMILTACGSSLLTEDGRKMNKEEKEALVTKTVREMLANKHYRIEVDKIMSQSARESISHEYSLEIKGDTVVSGLPFMGVARVAILGGGTGLMFTSKHQGYTSQRVEPDQTVITFNASNGEDVYSFRLLIFDNGRSEIRAYNRKQESMDYSGELNVWDVIYKR